MEGISKKQARELINIKGKVRGLALKSHAKFVASKLGVANLKKVEKKMADLGYAFDFEEINSMDFYPIGIEGLFLVLCHSELGFKENDFIEMGTFSSKFSLIIKLFAKYFVSVEGIAEKANKVWREYYTRGILEVVELDAKQGKAVLSLTGLSVHPFHCLHVQGHIQSILQMVLGTNIEGRETECPFRGDEAHIYNFNWRV